MDEVNSRNRSHPSIDLADRPKERVPIIAAADGRSAVPEPPPVRLAAVNDVVLISPPGLERALNALYVGVLRFERDDEPIEKKRLVEPILGPLTAPAPSGRRPRPLFGEGRLPGPIYRAENHRIYFEIVEPPLHRDELRPLGMEVRSLLIVEAGLTDLAVEFTRQRGLIPGLETLLFQDPAGNWLEIIHRREI